MLDRIAAFLEREAGHVAVALALVCYGSLLGLVDAQTGRELIAFAVGVLARSQMDRTKQ